MFCDEVLETIELIAAGELTASAPVAEHLASCNGCGAALAAARRVDALLRSRVAPAPPANFSSRVMNRLRLARWRGEQLLDWGFNIALVTAGVLVVLGLWMVMRQSGLVIVSSDAVPAVSSASPPWKPSCSETKASPWAARMTGTRPSHAPPKTAAFVATSPAA